MILNDYQTSPYALPEFSDVVATITLPIIFGDRPLGVLHSHTTQAGKCFLPDDIRLFQMLAAQAAIAIENARLYSQIQQYAATLEARVKKRTAELEEALRVKVEFLAKMSHELRTPLNFVLGFSDLLHQRIGGPLTSKQAIYLDRIQTGGMRLLSLVNDVLDIAQLDAGKSRLRLEPVILGPLIQEVLGLVQVQATQKEAEGDHGARSLVTLHRCRPFQAESDSLQSNSQCREVHAGGWFSRDHHPPGSGGTDAMGDPRNRETGGPTKPVGRSPYPPIL
jgi:signal transduction histidine kinase